MLEKLSISEKTAEIIEPPKKPLTAYFCFSKERRNGIREKNPELKMTQIAKILGHTWSALTESQKEPYVQQAAQDKIRYENELSKFQTII